MAEIWNMIRHRYLGVSATVAMLVLLPVLVIATQRPQSLSGIAEGATTIIFSPTSIEEAPLTADVGEDFFLNVLVDPGENIISMVRLDINYDPTLLKLSTQTPVEVNDTVFTEIVEGPTYTNGRIQMTLSVGSDLSKSISSRTRAATINFIPISGSSTNSTVVSFGEDTSASTVEVNDLEDGNVVSTTAPAHIKIN